MRTLPPRASAARSVLPPPGLDSLAPPAATRTLRPPRLPDLAEPGPLSLGSARGASIEERLANGGLELAAPATDVLALRLWGHVDLELAGRILTLIKARLTINGRRFVVFYDCTALTGYDSQARVLLTTRLLGSRDRFEAIHLLTRSRIVSMGVAVANLALGGFLTTYGPEQAARYEEALQHALRLRAPRG